jgi:class 3 adenylate cyclase
MTRKIARPQQAGPIIARIPIVEGLRGTRWTFTVSGHVTNLAARSAAAAGPGQVLAGPETARRAGDRYRLERLGRERLKILADAVELYQVVRRT